MGASNELPESEELDALFDRFLVRRQVAQVSSSQLPALARLAAGRLSASIAAPSQESASSNGSASPPQTAAAALSLEDFKCALSPASLFPLHRLHYGLVLICGTLS